MRVADVRLRKDLARSVRAGHPWIYGDALAPMSATIASGTVVNVLDVDGKFLARGLYEARSPIAVRVYTLDADEALDGALVERRLRSALAARKGTIDETETNAFRWLNGEGDLIPGVVVDRYAHVAVVRLDGDAVQALRADVVRAVEAVGTPLGITSIYERTRGAKGVLLSGAMPPERVSINECGVHYWVDVLRGQKTGTFLDQRENRRAIRPFCTGEDVANLFSYSGGFSVHAALAGARSVVSVDSAQPALDDARAHFTVNGLDKVPHELACADAFEWLERTHKDGRRFGVAIVDPPSFAPSEKSLGPALQAYRRLFAGALSVIMPGGILAAASCSSHVTHEAFMGVLADAGARANRRLRVLEVRGQPADHPSPPAFPEGRYLKFVIVRA